MKLKKNYKLVVAVDGSAASGKTTGAKKMSKKYGLHFLSSGLLYRYASFQLLKHKTKNKVRRKGGDKTRRRKIMGGWPKIKTHKIMKGGWGPLPKVNQSSIGQKGGGWLGAMLERN